MCVPPYASPKGDSVAIPQGVGSSAVSVLVCPAGPTPTCDATRKPAMPFKRTIDLRISTDVGDLRRDVDTISSDACAQVRDLSLPRPGVGRNLHREDVI
jgi:hypothetical protein